MTPTQVKVESTPTSNFSWDAMVQQAAAKPPSPLEATSKKAIEAMQQQAASMESMQEAAIARETQLLQDNQVLVAQNAQLHTLLTAERAAAQKLLEDLSKELEKEKNKNKQLEETVSHIEANFHQLTPALQWPQPSSSNPEVDPKFARVIGISRIAKQVHTFLSDLDESLKSRQQD